jgi:hypothetical protein
MPQPKRIEPGERITVALTRRERDLIVDRTFIGSELENRLRLATVSGSHLLAGLTLDEIDELAGFIAFEANHCDDPKIRRSLDTVYGRLEQLESRYTDQEPAQPVATPVGRGTVRFTAKQGQYLSFESRRPRYRTWTRVLETDLQRYFGVSPPTVHEAIEPGRARVRESLAPPGPESSDRRGVL